MEKGGTSFSLVTDYSSSDFAVTISRNNRVDYNRFIIIYHKYFLADVKFSQSIEFSMIYELNNFKNVSQSLFRYSEMSAI